MGLIAGLRKTRKVQQQQTYSTHCSHAFPSDQPSWLILPSDRVEGICQDQSDVLAFSGSFIAACAQIIIGSHTGTQVMSDTDRHTDRQIIRQTRRQPDRQIDTRTDRRG